MQVVLVDTSPQARSSLTGQSSTFTFDIDPVNAEVWTVSARLFSDDADGVTQPDHTIQGQFHVHGVWYADALAAAPTALSDLTSQGVYRDGVEVTFPAVNEATAYIALPNSVSNPTFMSGPLFLTTTSSALGTTHTLYAISANDYNGTGTLIVEVN